MRSSLWSAAIARDDTVKVTDLLSEVDDDLRAERARLIVRRYGALVLALLLLACAAIGIWQYLIWQHAKQDAKLSADYLAATHAADEQSGTDLDATRKHAVALFQPLTRAGDPAIRSLSRLRLAQLQGDTGDEKAAIADLDAVAGDGQAPSALRQLATLAAVQRQLSSVDPATLALRLEGIEQPGSPFRALALETSAMLDLRSGKTDRTRHTLLLLLADENATDAMRERANTLLQALHVPKAAGG